MTELSQLWDHLQPEEDKYNDYLMIMNKVNNNTFILCIYNTQYIYIYIYIYILYIYIY